VRNSVVRPSLTFYGLVAITVLGGILTIVDSPLDVELFGDKYFLTSQQHHSVGTIGVLLLVIGGWALSLTLHEFGHAITAYRGGDLSVADKGYLTMDVRRYTDPVFSLVLPIVFVIAGGIPLPGGAVWINNWALRSRAISSRVSLAGPLTNLVFGAVLVAIVAFVHLPSGLAFGLSYLALLQILAFVLNILPIPGLDGYGAIEPYLSPEARELGAKARPWAPLVLFMLLFAVPSVGQAFSEVSHFIFNHLGGDSRLSDFGSYAFRFWN